MITNRLAKSAGPAFEMNAAEALRWAESATRYGHAEAAKAWRIYASQLEIAERTADR